MAVDYDLGQMLAGQIHRFQWLNRSVGVAPWPAPSQAPQPATSSDPQPAPSPAPQPGPSQALLHK